MSLAILRHKADAACDGIGRRVDAHTVAIEKHRASRGVAQSEKGLGDLGASCADELVKTHDLTAPYLEAHVLIELAAGETANLQRDFAQLVVRGVAREVELSPFIIWVSDSSFVSAVSTVP